MPLMPAAPPPMPGMAPPLPPMPGIDPGMMGAPPDPMGGVGMFPSLDPAVLSASLGMALGQAQEQDRAQFAAMQEEAAAAALAESLRNRRNPEAEAMMTMPGPVADPLAAGAAGPPMEV